MRGSVNSRGITTVLHFTRLSNVQSILTHGLVPREQLETWPWNVPPTYNDMLRLDYQKNANCCSIGFPNYQMLYRLMMRDRNESWVVLGIKAQILWERECAFCVENAADGNVTRIPIAQRRGVGAFNAMFADYPGRPRAALGIPQDFTTHPQAEVLVFETIPPAEIKGAYCQTPQVTRELQAAFPAFRFIHNPAIFSYRQDWRHW